MAFTTTRGAMDRWIHFRRPDNLPALVIIVSGAPRQMSEDAVLQAVANFNWVVHLYTQNIAAHYKVEM